MDELTEEMITELRDQLLERRRELIDARHALNESWHRLHEPEIELEENAGKESAAREMERRNEILQAEIQNIDNALTKINENEYGICEACEEPIGLKRLRAIPWARYCVACAGARERMYGGGIETPTVSSGEEEMTDEEIVEEIRIVLRNDGRVKSHELEISCDDGIIYLDGVLPGESDHRVLLDLIEDILDHAEVVDNLRIDRQLWERRDRTPGDISVGESVESLMGEEEDADVDTATSLETNEPMSPPDELIPENPGR